MNIKKITTILLALTFPLVMTTQAVAADKKDSAKSSHQTMTPELKKDMSQMYLKMSECMKTEKSMEQCQKDVMKDCPVMKKTGHCPLMEGMKMDHSKMDHSGH